MQASHALLAGGTVQKLHMLQLAHMAYMACEPAPAEYRVVEPVGLCCSLDPAQGERRLRAMLEALQCCAWRGAEVPQETARVPLCSGAQAGRCAACSGTDALAGAAV